MPVPPIETRGENCSVSIPVTRSPWIPQTRGRTFRDTVGVRVRANRIALHGLHIHISLCQTGTRHTPDKYQQEPVFSHDRPSSQAQVQAFDLQFPSPYHLTGNPPSPSMRMHERHLRLAHLPFLILPSFPYITHNRAVRHPVKAGGLLGLEHRPRMVLVAHFQGEGVDRIDV